MQQESGFVIGIVVATAALLVVPGAALSSGSAVAPAPTALLNPAGTNSHWGVVSPALLTPSTASSPRSSLTPLSAKAPESSTSLEPTSSAVAPSAPAHPDSGPRLDGAVATATCNTATSNPSPCTGANWFGNALTVAPGNAGDLLVAVISPYFYSGESGPTHLTVADPSVTSPWGESIQEWLSQTSDEGQWWQEAFFDTDPQVGSTTVTVATPSGSAGSASALLFALANVPTVSGSPYVCGQWYGPYSGNSGTATASILSCAPNELVLGIVSSLEDETFTPETTAGTTYHQIGEVNGPNSATYVESGPAPTVATYSPSATLAPPGNWGEIAVAINGTSNLTAPDPTPMGEISVGQSITLTAAPSGGTPPYTIQWYASRSSVCSPVTSIAVGTGPTVPVAPTTNTYYYYDVTDMTGATAISSCDLIVVDPALVAGPVTPTGEISDSQSVTLMANPSGGTPPYSYLWYSGAFPNCALDVTPVAGGTSATVTVAPNSATYYCYTLGDSSIGEPPETATSAADLITVEPALVAGAITTSGAPAISEGQSITLTANPSGGVPPYSYQWYSSPPSSCTPLDLIAGASSQSYTATPTSTMCFCYRVSDSSIAGPEVAVACILVTVDPTLVAGQIGPMTPNISLEQEILLIAHPSGGVAPYSYQWYSGSSPICSGDTAINGATGSTYLASPWTSTYYCYMLDDNAGGQPPEIVFSPTDWVTVYPPLFAGEITPVDPTIVLGQSVTLTANPSGGVPPYSYQWYAGFPPSCANLTLIPGATGSTYTATPTSSTAYAYTLDDSAAGEPPENASFLCDLVTVQSTPCSYTVSFVETGLKAGETWFVTLNGVTMSATTSTGAGTAMTFTGVCTGTWSFTVTAPAGYATNLSSGNVTVAFGLPPGNEVYHLIAFSKIVCNYTVTFVEYGLPTSAKWDVSLNGVVKSATVTPSKTTITFTGKCPTIYSFSVSSPMGYTVSPSSGTVVVPLGATSKTEEYQLVVFQDPTNGHGAVLPLYERLSDRGSSWVSVLVRVALAVAAIGVTTALMRYRRPPGRCVASHPALAPPASP